MSAATDGWIDAFTSATIFSRSLLIVTPKGKWPREIGRASRGSSRAKYLWKFSGWRTCLGTYCVQSSVFGKFLWPFFLRYPELLYRVRSMTSLSFLTACFISRTVFDHYVVSLFQHVHLHVIFSDDLSHCRSQAAYLRPSHLRHLQSPWLISWLPHGWNRLRYLPCFCALWGSVVLNNRDVRGSILLRGK